MLEGVQFKTTGSFQLPRKDVPYVLERAGERHGIELDRDTLEARPEDRILQFLGNAHHFEMEQLDEGVAVTERFTTSFVYHLFVLLPAFFLGLYLLVPQPAISSLDVQLWMLLPLYSLPFMLLLWVYGSNNWTSLLSRIRNDAALGTSGPQPTIRNLKKSYSVLSFLPPIYILLLSIGVIAKMLTGVSLLTLVVAVSAFALLIAHTVSVATGRFCCEVFVRPRVKSILPGLSKNQVLMMAAAVTPPFLILVLLRTGLISVSHQSPIIFGIGFAVIYNTLIKLFLVFVPLLAVSLFYELLPHDRFAAYFGFRDTREADVHSIARWGVAGFIVVLSYAAVLVVVLLLNALRSSPSGRHPLFLVVVAMNLVPIGYFTAGLVYQLLNHLVQLRRLFGNSRTEDLELPVEIEAEIRIVEETDGFDEFHAGSLSTGLNGYVFVARPLIEEMDSDEVAAVLAHEQAHIRHGGSAVSFWIPFLSVGLLTGQNVLYSLIDYTEREYLADEYAGKIAGREALRSVLEKIEQAKESDRNEIESSKSPAPGFAPFAGDFGRPGVFDRYFGLFFGRFALQMAHPSIEDRLANLDS